MSPEYLRRRQILLAQGVPPEEITKMLGLPSGSGQPMDMAAIVRDRGGEAQPAQPVQQAPVPVAAPQGEMDPAQQAQAMQAAAQQRAQEVMAQSQQATIDPRLAALYEQRRQRITEDEGELDEEKKKSVWDAIAQAGFSMAQSESPYFMAALAQGMQAGLTGYNENKAKRAEKKARLQEQSENATIEEIKGEESAKSAALQRVVQERQLAAEELKSSQAALELAIESGTAQSKIDDLKTRAAIAAKTLAQMDEKFAMEKAESRARVSSMNRSNRGGGGDNELAKYMFKRNVEAVDAADKAFRAALVKQETAKYKAMSNPDDSAAIAEMNAARVEAAAALENARRLGVPGLERYKLRGGPGGGSVAASDPLGLR